MDMKAKRLLVVVRVEIWRRSRQGLMNVECELVMIDRLAFLT
jgi:hypothetical protein